MRSLSDFWRGRRVLVTGHTGFKGSWLSLWLQHLGARVTACALPPATEPNLYLLAGPWETQDHAIVDMRDHAPVRDLVRRAAPEVVFHLASQAIVRASFRDPIGTYATNVMGSLHVLEAIRSTPAVRAMVVVTSDKVYENDDGGRPFVETDRLGGKDPYSSSKACVELAVRSFRDSFLGAGDAPAVATARAGNIIGGGDWAEDRIIPDIVRALSNDRVVQLRQPKAVRPWQHVLDPLRGYLMLAERLVSEPKASPHAVNFGPQKASAVTVARLAELLAAEFGMPTGWEKMPGEHPPEAKVLTLDSTLAKRELGWQPLLAIEETIAWTAEWYRGWRGGINARALCLDQIARYEDLSAQGQVS